MGNRKSRSKQRAKKAAQAQQPLHRLLVGVLETCAGLVALPGRDDGALIAVYGASLCKSSCTRAQLGTIRVLYEAGLRAMITGTWAFDSGVRRSHADAMIAILLKEATHLQWLAVYGLVPLPKNVSPSRAFYTFIHHLCLKHGQRSFLNWIFRAPLYAVSQMMVRRHLTAEDSKAAIVAMDLSEDPIIDRILNLLEQGKEPPPAPLSQDEVLKRNAEEDAQYAAYCRKHPEVR